VSFGIAAEKSSILAGNQPSPADEGAEKRNEACRCSRCDFSDRSAASDNVVCPLPRSPPAASSRRRPTPPRSPH